jgi:hypothetical protein
MNMAFAPSLGLEHANALAKPVLGQAETWLPDGKKLAGSGGKRPSPGAPKLAESPDAGSVMAGLGPATRETPAQTFAVARGCPARGRAQTSQSQCRLVSICQN